jgi:hypothetical protein
MDFGLLCADCLRLCAMALLCTVLVGCAGAASNSSPNPSPNPDPPGNPSISVSVTPLSASVLLGDTVSFAATVSNASNTAVSWNVAGIPGGDATWGTISADGAYTAPAILPSPATATITATSVADPTKAAAATISIVSDISLTLSPVNPGIELGAQQTFQAAVISAGRPSTTILWSLSGPGCSGAGCGAVSTGGGVTAPQVLPSPSSVILTATSVADPSKQVTGIFHVTSNFSFSLTGPAAVFTGGNADYLATLVPVPNSNPSTTLSWSLSGSGCSGPACGTLSISSSGTTATYTAPDVASPPVTIHITATPLADPAKAAALDVALRTPLTLSPSSSFRAVDHRQRFTVAALNSADTIVNWFVGSVPGGNSAVGKICIAGSNPCQPVISTLAGEVDYLAPAAVPAPNPVTIAVVNAENPNEIASSSVTILPHLVVSVSPPAATIAPGAARLFTADVLGTSDQQVVWQISSAACSVPTDPCGVINPAGVYTAPLVAPTPNTIAITATSTEDSGRSATAAVTIIVDPVISSLLPSSLTAGGAGGATLRVEGANFASTSPGPGSLIHIDGAARSTLCDSTSVCSTTLTAADVALPGSRSVRVQNPGGVTSAPAALVIASAANRTAVIPLTPGAPDATGNDIVVVDLSTSGSSLPVENVNLNIVSVAQFQPSTNSCTLGGGPAVLVRPVSGMATAHLCAFSVSGLDPSLTYTLSGPGSHDIAIVGKEPLGLGIVHLTLAVPSTAQVGARTIFVENANHDVTAASGALEVR